MLRINIDKFKSDFSGNIILPGDKNYDTARVTYSVKEVKPAIVAQAISNQDIAVVLNFIKRSLLQMSIRSGGHSIVGFSTNNDGLVLDLSLMNLVTVLDEKNGLVRIGTGAL